MAGEQRIRLRINAMNLLVGIVEQSITGGIGTTQQMEALAKLWCPMSACVAGYRLCVCCLLMAEMDFTLCEASTLLSDASVASIVGQEA